MEELLHRTHNVVSAFSAGAYFRVSLRHFRLSLLWYTLFMRYVPLSLVITTMLKVLSHDNPALLGYTSHEGTTYPHCISLACAA